MNRYSPLAAVLALVALLIPTLLPSGGQPTYASDVIMVPEGGRLDALDREGRVRGPCPLKHTDVDVAVTGHFTRVTLTQKFHNPYPDKIEAVYTFPLSHRAAVDRMTMTIGDRIIEGEVKEREQARAIYEAARAAGHVASLLEQERPNIFTQSLANIEPGAEIGITISYVELLESKDGTYTFEFPMVVGPRYIPGQMRTASAELPARYQQRAGVVLLGPAKLTLGEAGEVKELGTLQTGKLAALVHDAVAIQIPPLGGMASESAAPAPPVLWYRFEATYCDASKDFGELYTNGTGHVNGRWFYTDPAKTRNMGTGYSPDTTQVPDASRITPEPVKPGTRAGHDIAVSVTIDTGGPAIRELTSALHEIEQERPSPSQARLRLRNTAEIPNRDFVLTWKHTTDQIEEATFTHTGQHGNFFTLILQPPERVTDAAAVAREVVFVLDTSGSMNGLPIEKAKAVMARAMAGLRPQDTFNLITFSGDTHILWEQPRPGSPDNIAAAQQFLASRQGRGGTEMMKAIEAALVQPPRHPDRNAMDRPASAPIRICCFMTDGYVGNDMQIIDAVKKNAKTTRVFSFGIGNSVNRYLLDGMARAGRGEVEYVLLNSDADAAVQRFAQRIQTPVLTDIELVFSEGLKVLDLVPGQLPDLFDVQPLVLHGRYTAPGRGILTIRGNTGSGRYERVVQLDLPERQPEHDTIATLWARGKVEELMNHDLAAAQQGNFPAKLRSQIVNLGEQFQIMTQFTSFVAIEKARVTIAGKPRLVAVPIEMPEGVSYEGVFGGEAANTDRDGYFSEIKDTLFQQLSQQHNDFADIDVDGVLDVNANQQGGALIGLGDGHPAYSRGDAGGPRRTYFQNWSFGYQLRSGQSESMLEGEPAESLPPAFSVNGRFGRGGFDGGGGGFGGGGSGGGDGGRSSGGSVHYGVDNKAPGTPPAPGQLYAPSAEDQSRRTPSTPLKPADLETRQRMSSSIPLIRFADAPLMQVIEFLEDQSNVKIDVNWNRLSLVGIASTTTVSLNAQNARFETALEMLLKQIGAEAGVPLGYEIVDGVVRIATLEELNQSHRIVSARRTIPLFCERLTLSVCKLVEEGKIDEARKWADELAKAAPEFKIGVQMRDVLTDETLAPSERDLRIAALADEARKPVDAALREVQLRRRLDEWLYRLARTPASQPAPPDITLTQNAVQITMLLADVKPETLAALAESGFVQEALAPSSRLVVGRIPRDKIAELAMLDRVRRIEPTTLAP